MIEQDASKACAGDIELRNPSLEDGSRMWRLAHDSEQLESNSCYAYLLLSTHFANTSVVAEHEGRVVGFVAGYRPPTDPAVIFVWQIGVDAGMRGRGVASSLLRRFVTQPSTAGARYLEATVSPSNEASRRLFESFARRLGVPCEIVTRFRSRDFGETAHEEEHLYRIGPLPHQGQ